MTTLYLIRHAEAEGNAYRRIDGWYNSLVTPNGLRQIAALERRFAEIPVDACYASDLYRTCRTAAAVYVPKQLLLHPDPRLREVHLGRWENVPFGYLEQFEPERMRQFNHDIRHWSVKGGETFEQYTARALAALREIAEANVGRTAAVFSHGCVLRGVQSVLLGGQTPPYCDNTAVSRLTYENGAFQIDFLNDTSHLPPEISTFERQKWWRKDGEGQDFNMWFRQTEDGCFTSFLRDMPVGHVRFARTGEDVGEIRELELDAAYRGRRLGEQLIGCAVCELRRAGVRLLTVFVPDAHPAYGFFRYFGFQPDGARLVRSIEIPALP